MARARVDLSRWDIGPIESHDQIPDEVPPEPEPMPVYAAPRRAEAAPVPIATHRAPSPAPFVWVGAHGGAGVSSLAEVSGLGLELSKTWPAPHLGWPSAVALVCRTSAAGLDAGTSFLHAWASHSVPGVTVVALVAVADSPGRLPKGLRTRLHELSGAVPSTFSVPWVPAWREHPRSGDKNVQRTAAAIAALTSKEISR